MILPARELMPLVRAALERGQRVRMTVSGSSMIPFLRNEDVVELEPARKLRLGDMVLARTETERYVLHRIVRMDGAAFFIRGDAQLWNEGPFIANAVLGRVTTVWRKGCLRNLEHSFWRLAGLLWLRTNPLGFYLLRAALAGRRRIRNLAAL
ncbi:MAG: S24/S26 family peptidase [Candidatus Electronema sp. VV]